MFNLVAHYMVNHLFLIEHAECSQCTGLSHLVFSNFNGNARIPCSFLTLEFRPTSNHEIRIMYVTTLFSQAHKTYPTKHCSQSMLNENYGKQPCAARTLCPFQKQPYAVAALCCREAKTFVFPRNSLMLWGSLVLQRCKDLMSSTKGPTFSVFVMLIGNASVFSTSKRTMQLGGQGMRNNAKVRPAITRGSIIKRKRCVRTTCKQKYPAILQMVHTILFIKLISFDG